MKTEHAAIVVFTLECRGIRRVTRSKGVRIGVVLCQYNRLHAHGGTDLLGQRPSLGHVRVGEQGQAQLPKGNHDHKQDF
jgi:hypothetical protein